MIVCADDYGLRADIDEAILELVASGKLSAVSCMAVFERCTPGLFTRLKSENQDVDVGLHLCLTDEGLPLSTLPASPRLEPLWPSFRALAIASIAGRVVHGAIDSQIARQHALFVEKSGREPDFIDGHLYVHQWPAVRRALVRFVQGLTTDNRPYIRNTKMSALRLWKNRLPWLKAIPISFMGCRMNAALRSAGLPTNKGFAGIYDFRRWPDYARNLPRFCDSLPARNGMLVVHPGKDDPWRNAELEALRKFRHPERVPNRFDRRPMAPPLQPDPCK